jgi:ABC-2 type transport system permease protein
VTSTTATTGASAAGSFTGRLVERCRVLGYAALSGLHDYAATFTLRTWLLGWFLRVLAQVVFFALIGRLVGSTETTRFLLVGNAIALATSCAMIAVPATTWERSAGTLPLVIACPTSPALVFLGRSVHTILDGLASSLGSFVLVGLLFGLPLPWPRVFWVAPLTLLVTVSAYLLATFLGALVLRAVHIRNLVANIAIYTLLTLGGANLPPDSYPPVLNAVSVALPLRHGLEAIRGLLTGTSVGPIIRNAMLEAMVGLAWLGLSVLLFHHFAESGRRDGSIEYAS